MTRLGFATREEAQRERDRLAEADPGSTWLVSERAPSEFHVVRVGITPSPPALSTATQARPRPPDADDPRSSHQRNLGGNYA